MKDLEINPKIAMMFMSTQIRVLGARILVILAMFMVFGLACATMFDPSPIRLATVAVFGLLIFWPVCRLDREQAKERAIVAPGD